MSLFVRIRTPLPTTQRAYSSFFSSKPGGGRYFNSSKPPKTVVNAAKSKSDHANVNEGSGHGSGSSHNGHGNGGNKFKTTGGEDSSSSLTNNIATHDNSPHTSRNISSNATSTDRSLLSTSSTTERYMFSHHPAISAQDYKLHQFFSLHRPLLLHAQPPSAIFESPEQPLDLFAPSSSASKVSQTPVHLTTLDDPPEASPEADADAARQLARALVMNRVGGTVSWEGTLTKLGLDGNTEEGRAQLAKEWAREWDTIYADSVKRKRKKKMKKHK